jgi:hypothetical protein
MINNKVIQNCTVPFPPIQALVNEHALGKIKLKNIYQAWQGESIKQIRDKHEQNPYTLRIGTPSTDDQLKNDALYFILHYLSYNPITKDVEMREIVPYRNVDKIYIGQSIDENSYKNYKLFVNGNAVVNDIYIKGQESLKEVPLGKLVVNLIDRLEKLQFQVNDLQRQLGNQHIYTQGT